jgi:hypothetical protein
VAGGVGEDVASSLQASHSGTASSATSNQSERLHSLSPRHGSSSCTPLTRPRRAV